MERIECNSLQEAKDKFFQASERVGAWGETLFENQWNKHPWDRSIKRMKFDDALGKRAQLNGVDFIETRSGRTKRGTNCGVFFCAYEIKTDVKSTWEPAEKPGYRTVNNKLNRTIETIEAIAPYELKLRFENGTLNYYIERGENGWFTKLNKTAGKLNEKLPEYDGRIIGRSMVFISVIDGEKPEGETYHFEDKTTFVNGETVEIESLEWDGKQPGDPSGAIAYIISVPDTMLIESVTTGKCFIEMPGLFERKAADAITKFTITGEGERVENTNGTWRIDTTEEYQPAPGETLRELQAKTIGQQGNGAYIWGAVSLSNAELADFIERVETKRFYERQTKKF